MYQPAIIVSKLHCNLSIHHEVLKLLHVSFQFLPITILDLAALHLRAHYTSAECLIQTPCKSLKTDLSSFSKNLVDQ